MRAGELVQAVKFSNAILHGLYFKSRRDKVQVIFELMDSALGFAALPDTAIFLHIEWKMVLHGPRSLSSRNFSLSIGRPVDEYALARSCLSNDLDYCVAWICCLLYGQSQRPRLARVR